MTSLSWSQLMKKFVFFSLFLFVALFVQTATAESNVTASSWLLSAMKSWTPLEKHLIHKETLEEVAERYESIANDAVAVAFDSEEKPIFDGPYARQRTALQMLAIARYESDYVRRIDEGNCRPNECDHGLAACIMQVHTNGLVLEKDTYSFARTKTAEWRAENHELILNGKSLRDRKMCFRVALHKIRESLAVCRSLPNEDRLGIYTGEGCVKNKINPKSRTRIEAANRYVQKNGLPLLSDEGIYALSMVD